MAANVNKLCTSNTLECLNSKPKLLHFQSYLRYDLLFHVEFKYLTIFLQNSLFFILKNLLSRNVSLKKNVKKISLKSRTGKVEMLLMHLFWLPLVPCILKDPALHYFLQYFHNWVKVKLFSIHIDKLILRLGRGSNVAKPFPT